MGSTFAGPGGGGAGGRIFFQPGGLACPGVASSGLAGTGTCSRNERGAEPSVIDPAYSGVVDQFVNPFVEPSAVTDAGLAASVRWLSPDAGQTLDVRRPRCALQTEPGATVAVTLDTVSVTSLAADLNGVVVFQPVVDLSDGVHQLEATTGGASASVSFTVDTLSPDVPRIDTPAHHSFLATSPAVVSGRASLGTVIHVQLDDLDIGEAPTDASGRWVLELDPASPLPDGPHTARAWAVSASGRPGELSPIVNFTVSAGLGADRTVTVGCGCSSLDAASAFLVVLWWRRSRSGRAGCRPPPASA